LPLTSSHLFEPSGQATQLPGDLRRSSRQFAQYRRLPTQELGMFVGGAIAGGNRHSRVYSIWLTIIPFQFPIKFTL
jgi:hypothetical protein